MSQLDTLLAAVTAAPDDMAPRRAFAAAIKATDAERARFIELQLAIREQYRAGRTPADADIRSSRDIARARGRAWAGKLADQVPHYSFYGGFVEEIEAPAALVIGKAATLPRLAPLRFLRVRELAGQLSSLVSLPLLAQIRVLDVAGNNLRDVDVAELVQSPRLRGLRVLRINNNPEVGVDGLRMIARHLPDLQFVQASSTDAPLVIRSEDWDGSIPEVSWTRARRMLVEEFGHLPWLDTQDEPSQHAI